MIKATTAAKTMAPALSKWQTSMNAQTLQTIYEHKNPIVAFVDHEKRVLRPKVHAIFLRCEFYMAAKESGTKAAALLTDEDR